MAIYTQLQLSDIRALLEDYGLSAQDHAPMQHGQTNSSYRVTTERAQVIVTIIENKSVDEVRAMVALTDYLHGQGLAVPRMLRTRTGELVGERAGCSVVVKEYIPGVVEPQLSPASLRALGAEMARLHALTLPPGHFGVPTDHPYGLRVFSSFLDEPLEHRAGHPYLLWLRERAAELTAALDSAGRERLPRGLIHGDVFWDNVIVRADAPPAIIDFEDACVYYLAFDIGMAIVGTCFRAGQLSRPAASALVDGYQSIRPLDESERAMLVPCIEYAAVATSFWRYRQYHVYWPGHAEKDAYRDMQERADAVRADPGLARALLRPG